MPRGKQNNLSRTGLHDTFIVCGSISFVILLLLASMLIVEETDALQPWADKGLEGVLLSPINRYLVIIAWLYPTSTAICHKTLHRQKKKMGNKNFNLINWLPLQ